MQCQQCQHENPVEANFCLNCGNRLAKVCPQCQQVLPPEANFCMSCGHRLAAAPQPEQPEPRSAVESEPLSYTPQYLAEKILTSRRALEGERKQVTVLFADIKDSTELIKDLDPEAAQQLLDPAIHIMIEAVHRFEGTVNQVLGDGVMSIFGAPIAHEDHALRGWRSLESASVSYGKATPYLPVVELLKRYVQIDDSDDARTVRAKVTGHLLTLDESLQETIPALRTLVESGLLSGEPGSYRVVRELSSTAVPPTVQAILAARIDRFPSEEKQLLQTAAVIGMEVPFSLLQAIAGLSNDVLYRGLGHLQGAEFLYETNLYPEREYTFKHALTHEVAYGSLFQERRRVLHAQIVQALESLASDGQADQVERLAHHAVRGELWDKALVYLRQSGARAMARSAHHEAVTCFEQALAVLQHLPAQRAIQEQVIDIRLDLRSAHIVRGDMARVLEELREAETLAEAPDDTARLGRVSLSMSIQGYLTGQYEQGMAAGQRSLTLAVTTGDVGAQSMTNCYLGLLCHGQGNYRQAVDYGRRAVACLEGDLLHERFGQAVGMLQRRGQATYRVP